MNEKNPSYFFGRLSFDRLFVGSKSEGLYPVLHANQNLSYRLHSKGVGLGDESPLLPFNGKTVKVFGIPDNTRGHWRIVLEGEDACLIDDGCPEGLEAMIEAIEDARLSPGKDSDGEATS